MSEMDQNITILADYREKLSGIPDLLLSLGIETSVCQLRAGDYLINERILVERKTKDDFVSSLIQNRLFSQCSALKRNSYHHFLLIIEGNPYNTDHDISREAVKGALLSISLSWQIPIVYTKNAEETAQLLVMAARQYLQDKLPLLRKGYKPKRNRKRQLYFLQGLPLIGPKNANELLEHFGTIENIMKATEKELIKVHGIGKERAMKIWKFIRSG